MCVTPFVPYEGVPHAGGLYVLNHLRELSAFFDIVIVAPKNAENDYGSQNVPAFVSDIHLVAAPRVPRSARHIFKALRGTSFEPGWIAAAIKRETLRGHLGRAAVLDLQWTQSAALGRQVKRLNPTARQVLTVHDVLTQRWMRSCRESRSLGSRVFFGVRAVIDLLNERRSFGSADVVVAFSEDDARRAKQINAGSNVEVFVPPLLESTMPASDEDLAMLRQRRERNTVLFTGALDRPENEEAVLDFLRQSWAEVLTTNPLARFVVAGARPSDHLQRVAASHRNVELTGFVDSLDPYYASASVFVVPLRRGAGVKFKTVTAMLWGVPIVSTTVGAEGVIGRDLLASVTDDATAFTKAVNDVLKQPDTFEQEARDAATLARTTYSYSSLRSRLYSAYLIDPSSAADG